ncbi:MAG: NifB/NifX family molybdenum-iron cluster-binding protein [Bacillota bacterium]
MKIAVSAKKEGLDAEIDPRFGRAKWIIIYDDVSKEIENIDNTLNFNAAQGAGIKTAELVVRKGCSVVITGHLGPKAFNVLAKAGVKGYLREHGKVIEAVLDLKEGKLNECKQADVEGHW